MAKYSLFIVLVLSLVMPMAAQETPKKPLRRVPSDIARQVKDKSSEEMLEILRKVDAAPLPIDDVDVVTEAKRKKGNTLIGLADALLNTNPSDDIAEEAFLKRMNGLGLLMQLKPDDVTKILAQKRELEKDGKYPKVVAECDAYIYIRDIRKTFLSKRVAEKDFYRVAEELKPLVRDNPESPYVAAAGLLLSAASAYEGDKNLDGFADKFRDEFVKTFRESGSEKLIELAKQIEIDATQSVVPGKRLKITGLSVDGKPFDIKMLRGKVVLIDFWATWCGPCRGEIPNMKQLYTKYNHRGFEIVGISVDKQVPTLQSFIVSEKIPWISLSETVTLGGGMPGIAGTYGIRSYPTMWLLDREGRVISTSARGENLKMLLQKEFR